MASREQVLWSWLGVCELLAVPADVDAASMSPGEIASLAERGNFDADPDWEWALGKLFYADAGGEVFARVLARRVLRGEISAATTLNARDAWGVSLSDLVGEEAFPS